MTSYYSAFGNRDIQSVGQIEGGKYKNPKVLHNSTWNGLMVKNLSSLPMTAFDMSYGDPVYNIALQNPVAQPGGGATGMAKLRMDLTDLYGVSSHDDTPPIVPVFGTPTPASAAFSSYQMPAVAIENQYYNYGGRASGDALYVENSAFGGEDLASLATRGKRSFGMQQRMGKSNTVVFTGTSLDALKNPVGSKDNTHRCSGTSSYTETIPQKTIVSSTDYSLFSTY